MKGKLRLVELRNLRRTASTVDNSSPLQECCLSTEGGPSLSPDLPLHRNDDDEPVSTSAAGQRTTVRSDFTSHRSVRKPFDEVLPSNDFLRDLCREMRRSERSATALSLMLYRRSSGALHDVLHMDRLLEKLHSSKRETDILGHVGTDSIAVLCPDTDEHGTKGFIRKLGVLASDAAFSVVAATYPDDLFESLANGTATLPAFQPFLVSDATTSARGTYAMKRSMDIAGSLIAICLLWPLMLVVAAVIAFTSRGPIVFKQTRLGKGGVPFTFYKFRSMTVNGDDGIHREFVANHIKGEPTDATPEYKLKSDPRVTSIGRLILKTSIDELPQFFNVLKGEMSLVGPRPCIPYEATHYQPWHLRRILSAKPGITGLWQVEGRSKVSFSEMVRMDVRYIKDCSFALDFKLLFKTILVVLRRDGAA